MAKQIHNFGELAGALNPQLIAIFEKVADDVKKEIDKALAKYYSEYDPSVRQIVGRYWYDRTDQLRNCCKIGQAKVSGNSVSIEIYLDIDSLNYESPGADAYKTVVAANAGLHGGWDVSSFVKGQTTWDSITDNDGSRWGSGTQIWEEPMNELFGGGKLVSLFKKHAKAHGLNLK